MVGGVPAYLEWLDPDKSLQDNIRDVVLSPGSMFTAEPRFLLYDEVREPQVYLAILKAIGSGAHSLEEIRRMSMVSKTHLPAYLSRLKELHLVERRLPATVPMPTRRTSRKGRYHLSDPYFRFFFRFLASRHDSLSFDQDEVLQQVNAGLRAFVGLTAFEELSRTWLHQAGKQGKLPFAPEVVGSHWGASVQVDAVAINWHTRDILLGECKWGENGVNNQIVRDLIEKKTPRVLKGLPGEAGNWKTHFCIFSRARITEDALASLQESGGFWVSPKDFEEVLSDTSS